MDQQGAVAVITGASSGIGLQAAKLLAARRWHIVGQGRDPARCNAALADIRQCAAPGVQVAFLRSDLSLLSDTAELARRIAELTPRVTVLLNNAGGVRDRMIITPEGNEATFAGNHLGHFLLTKRLMPLLHKAADISVPGSVRIIATSSSGHESCAGIDWADLQGMRDWISGRNYCLAKLCNLLFTLELSRRTAAQGIVALAMHPGVVNSNFRTHATAEMQRHMQERPGDTPERSGETLAWLAADPALVTMSGGYFHDMAPATPAPAALDHAAAKRLWDESEALLGRSGY